MWFDALLAYLHFSAVFVLFAFLTVEVVLARHELDARAIGLLCRVDLWYVGATAIALVTGMSRAIWGAKGWAFYSGDVIFWAKAGVFGAVVALSVPPALAFARWARKAAADATYRVPELERKAMRRYLMWELHLAALIPLLAVAMARGLGR